jgi:hypothetical protein
MRTFLVNTRTLNLEYFSPRTTEESSSKEGKIKEEGKGKGKEKGERKKKA